MTGQRRSRRRRVLAIGGGTLAVAAISAAAVGVGGGASDQPARSSLPPATEQVARRTLVQLQDVDGSVGYGDPRSLFGRATGMVTWLPAEGAEISRNGVVYKVDNLPVVLLYGALPMYRALSPGAEGADVRQLERNLWALGYRGFTVDDDYTDRTAAAVERWQERLGVAETGTVTPASVVVAPGPIRVADHKVQIGDPAGAGPIFDYTGTSRVVTVELDVRYQQMAKRGRKVTIELPSGETTTGTITSVGTVATANEGGDSTVRVVVRVDQPKALGRYDKAPVTVQLVADQRKNVLTVPVAALLALAEGGYGLEVVDGATTRIVQVEVGMFAQGKVEVRGDGITAGMTVGVPA